MDEQAKIDVSDALEDDEGEATELGDATKTTLGAGATDVAED